MAIMKCENPRCAGITTQAAKFQTQEYGEGMRVHNKTKTGYACTICSHTITDRTPTKKKDEKEEKA